VDDSPPAPKNNHLTIIHLLGWMVGCGVVLTVHRIGVLPYQHGDVLVYQVLDLGTNIGYGTFLSGLMLFALRWATHQGSLPSQPGHWIIVLGGLGYLIGVLPVTVPPILDPQHVFWRPAISLWLTLAIGLIFVLRLRGASWPWRVTAGLVVITIAVNAVACTGGSISEYLWSTYPRGWTRRSGWWVALLLHLPDPDRTALAAPLVCLPAIWAAEIADHRRGIARDWLHNVGIAAVSLVGLIDFGRRLYLGSIFGF
jgi:hypothetical protein